MKADIYLRTLRARVIGWHLPYLRTDSVKVKFGDMLGVHGDLYKATFFRVLHLPHAVRFPDRCFSSMGAII